MSGANTAAETTSSREDVSSVVWFGMAESRRHGRMAAHVRRPPIDGPVFVVIFGIGMER